MEKILVIGSLNMDYSIRLNRIPNLGETIRANSYIKSEGGKGANQSYTIGKLGGDITMIGAVGNDNNGEMLKKNLQSVGVDISGIETIENEQTGTAFITVDKLGNNSIMIIEGANGKVDKEVINKNINKINEANIILMQLEIPIETIKYVCEIAKDKRIILDPAPADINILDKELLKKIYIMKPNETELNILTNMPTETIKEVISAGNKLLEYGVQNLIVSIGKKGSILINKNGYKHFPAIESKVVDTTAAGDSFIAGITLGLANNKEIEECIKLASKIASITVSRKGAQASIPSKEELHNIDK